MQRQHDVVKKSMRPTYSSIYVIAIADGIFERLQDNGDGALSTTEARTRVRKPKKNTMRLPYPLAVASNGLHFPSGERMPPWV